MNVSGVLAPPPTPMNDAGNALNLHAIEPLTDLLLSTGVDALFINGTTGEGSMLSTAERRAATEAFLTAVRRRAPVVVQVGSANTRDSVALAQHAEDHGADAVAVVGPYYFAHDQASMKEHLRAVAKATALPTFAYDIPSRTSNSYAVSTLRELFEDGSIIGAKDSTGDFPRLLELLDITGFVVLPGSDIHVGQLLLAGAHGTVTGPGSCFPEPFALLWRAAAARDHAAVSRWQGVVNKVSRTLGYGADLALLKCVLGAIVPGMGRPRPPHPGCEAQRVALVLERLEHIARDNDLAAAAERFAAARGGG